MCTPGYISLPWSYTTQLCSRIVLLFSRMGPTPILTNTWTYHTKTSTQLPLSQKSKSTPQTLNNTTHHAFLPLPSNKYWEHTNPVFFNPVAHSWITTNKICQSLQVRSLIVWSSLRRLLINDMIQKYTGIFKFGLRFYVQTRPKKRENHLLGIFNTLKERNFFHSDGRLTGFCYAHATTDCYY